MLEWIAAEEQCLLGNQLFTIIKFMKAMLTRSDNLFGGGFRNPLDIIRLLVVLPKFIKLIYRLFGDARVQLHLKLLLILTLAFDSRLAIAGGRATGRSDRPYCGREILSKALSAGGGE
jgi:hypothetical protein